MKLVQRLGLVIGLGACALASSGCASTLAQETAEVTACPVEQTTIVDSRLPREGPASWTATCAANDIEWFCSRAHDKVICSLVPRPKSDVPPGAPTRAP